MPSRREGEGSRSVSASPHTPAIDGGDAESPWPSPSGGVNPPWDTMPEDPSGGRIYDDRDSSKLPKLHLHAYRGDLNGVLGCITDGHSVHDTVVMRNQAGRLVCGITPLFLAAQKGHYKLCKLLVGNGANPAQPAYIQGSADLCTPLQVARLNLHLRVSMYLGKAVEARKAEDRVLKDEEEGNTRQNRDNAEPDAARGVQHTVMANLGDLSGWDPNSGSQPPLQTGNLIARMLKRNKVDLMTWRPDMERTKEGEEQMKTSANRTVDANELENLEVANHTSILNNYLQGADLTQWDPEGEEAFSTQGGAAASSVAATGRRSLDLDNTGGGAAGAAAGPSSERSNSRAASPAPQQQQQQYQQQQQQQARALGASPHVAQHQHARAAAAAAAASMTRPGQGAKSASSGGGALGSGDAQRSFQRPPPPLPPVAKPARARAMRFYAHGSDSDDDDEDLEASASVPAAAPVSLRA